MTDKTIDAQECIDRGSAAMKEAEIMIDCFEATEEFAKLSREGKWKWRLAKRMKKRGHLLLQEVIDQDLKDACGPDGPVINSGGT